MTYYDVEIEELNDKIKYLKRQQDRVQSDDEFDTMEIKIDEILNQIEILKEQKETAIKNCGNYSDDNLGI